MKVSAQIAQLVEQRTENPRVTGSIPVLGTACGCSSMVEHQPSKLDTWVRFPSPAFCVRWQIHRVVGKTDNNMREWLSWWSATLPRSRPRVRVPSRALKSQILKKYLGFLLYKNMQTNAR